MNVKLKYIQDDIDNRRKVANYYLKILKIKIILPTVLEEEGHVWHLFVIRTINRFKLQKYLLDNGIQTIIHYPIPIHKQKAYEEYENLSLPITEKIHNEVLSLPLSPVISLNDLNNIVTKLNLYDKEKYS